MHNNWRKWLLEPSTKVVAIGLVVIFGLWLGVEPQTFSLFQSLLLVVLIGFVLVPRYQHDRLNLSLLEVPFALARDADIFARYQYIAGSLTKISRTLDPIFRELALESLDETVRRVHSLADGELTFEGTEAWRLVYERLLRSPGLYQYRSVALIQSETYWQDEPGRKSMAVNFELQSIGQVSIKRIAIIADDLWPTGDLWPAEMISQWIHEQHARGIPIGFVRESAISAEPDLLADIGIYGSRAVGTQELDHQSRTTRFRLEFDFATVAAAEERWNRLAVYSESFASYLDRYEIGR
jgi:hypothetical protein